jgi:hypothetical protein
MIDPEQEEREERERLRQRIRCEYQAASGTDIRDCVLLGQRYDEVTGFRAHRGESWVCRTEPAGDEDGFEFITECQVDTILSGIWRSPSGACFVTGAQLFYHPDPRADLDGTGWIYQDLPPYVAANGVWGLDDDHVYVWGGEWDGPRRMYRWRDGALEEMASPTFRVKALHGVAPDCLYAVGEGGAIARWDGYVWHPASSPVSQYLTSVYVASPDEVWAVGDDGCVLEGSRGGWGIVARGPRLPETDIPLSLFGVCRWKDHLWVAAGNAGLWRRKGITNELECVKPEVLAVGFDARGPLFICEKRRVTSTDDGESFLSAAERSLEEFRAPYLLMEGL